MQIFITHSSNNPGGPKVDIMGISAEEAQNLFLMLMGEPCDLDPLVPIIKALRPFKECYWK